MSEPIASVNAEKMIASAIGKMTIAAMPSTAPNGEATKRSNVPAMSSDRRDIRALRRLTVRCRGRHRSNGHLPNRARDHLLSVHAGDGLTHIRTARSVG